MVRLADVLTIIVRAHEVLFRAGTDTSAFLREYGLVDGGMEIVAAASVVLLTWLFVAAVVSLLGRAAWLGIQTRGNAREQSEYGEEPYR